MIKVKLLSPEARMPFKTNHSDIGWDLVPVRREIKNGYLIYHTDVAVEPPEGYFFYVFPRSSQCNVNWVFCNSVGVVDPEFRGGIQIRMRPVGSVYKSVCEDEDDMLRPEFSEYIDPYPFELFGDAIAQLVLARIENFPMIESELSDTKRGSGGFGSTNK